MNDRSNKKYHQLVVTAKELFTRHGIKRVSIDEICKVSNVSKMTFYKYFENKIELVKEVLEQDFTEGFKSIDAIMAQKSPFHEKMVQIMKYKIEKAKEYGDLFLSEVNTLPELIAFLDKMNMEKRRYTMDVFTEGQKEGAIRKDIRPEFYQYLLRQLNVMAQEEQLISIFPTLDERIKELIKLVLYGILDKENEP